MTFRTICRIGLPASQSPFRVVDDQDRELEWINRFLDQQLARGLASLSLRAYAHTLLHFVRWWSLRPGVDATRFTADQFTEATLVDYVRDQLDEQPKPAAETINNRSALLRRLLPLAARLVPPLGARLWPQPPDCGRGSQSKSSATCHGSPADRAGAALLAQLPHGARSGHCRS